jgi:diguanylate cyclase (GGDEF)-like protein
MSNGMEGATEADRLLAIIETQNEIAATSLDLEAVMALVAQRARQLSGATACVIELLVGEEMIRRVAAGAALEHPDLRLPVPDSLSGACAREGRILHCEDSHRDPRVNRLACERLGARSILCVPLSYQERAVGVLKVYDARPNAFTGADIRMLGLLSGVIGAHMAHAADFQLLAHDSRHDGLTGLLNRHAFDDRLAGELDRARRDRLPLSLCLLDLDGFKAVNDELGHPAGDRVLRAVAGELSDLRGEDIAFRIGGDEFALLLPGASLEGASAAAARIESALRHNHACLGVVVSTGIATLADGDDTTRLLDRADVALHEIKRALPLRRRLQALSVA